MIKSTIKASVWLTLALGFHAPLLQAQQPPAPRPGEFFEFLTDCLTAPETSTHYCAVDYLDIVDSGADDPVARSVIKGKYNTCYLYPDTELKGDEKGYECYNNLTGLCVSGDCCNIAGC